MSRTKPDTAAAAPAPIRAPQGFRPPAADRRGGRGCTRRRPAPAPRPSPPGRSAPRRPRRPGARPRARRRRQRRAAANHPQWTQPGDQPGGEDQRGREQQRNPDEQRRPEGLGPSRADERARPRGQPCGTRTPTQPTTRGPTHLHPRDDQQVERGHRGEPTDQPHAPAREPPPRAAAARAGRPRSAANPGPARRVRRRRTPSATAAVTSATDRGVAGVRAGCRRRTGSRTRPRSRPGPRAACPPRRTSRRWPAAHGGRQRRHRERQQCDAGERQRAARPGRRRPRDAGEHDRGRAEQQAAEHEQQVLHGDRVGPRAVCRAPLRSAGSRRLRRRPALGKRLFPRGTENAACRTRRARSSRRCRVSRACAASAV